MEIIFSEKALNYKSPGHPESPERVKKAYEYLKDKFEFVIPEPAQDEDARLVHADNMVEKLKQGEFYDPDCPVYENLWEQALLSAGGAICAQKLRGLSLMRPPGHHAGKHFIGGFCYLNNLAIAVKKSELKTVIVDIDGHHGNGTEDIFTGDDQAYFISLHRGFGFPGTGHESKDNIINFPLTRSDDDTFIENLKSGLDQIPWGEIEQIAVSAGFDAHERDPLASLGITVEGYRRIGALLRRYNIPVFAVLEGGYIGEDLGKNIESFINGISSVETED